MSTRVTLHFPAMRLARCTPNHANMSMSRAANLVNLGFSAHQNGKKLQKCQGDCDNDSHCATNLKCFQRDAKEEVPGCLKGGDGDVTGRDYCYDDTGAQCDEVSSALG